MNMHAPSSAFFRPRVLLLSPFLYGAKSSNGGAVLCWAQLTQLAEFCELGFLGFSGIEEAQHEAAQCESLAAACAYVDDVPLRIRKTDVLRARLRSMRMGAPELATLCDTPEMAKALARALSEFKPDVVWIQFPQMAQYVQRCEGLPCIMDVQDAYSLSAFRQAQRRRGLSALRAWLDWVCWARYESRHYARCAAVLTLSDQDAQVLQALTPACPASSMGLPLGQARRPQLALQPLQIGFAGSFGHPPNTEGLAWFLAQVWPRVRAALPAAKFVVAGRNPPASLLAAGGQGVEPAGFVPDIFDFYASCAVTVVPLVSGGGVKIKTVEALLAGSAVVTTRIGAEGTGVQAGKQALIEDDPAAFAAAIVRLVEDAALAGGLRQAAMQHAESMFSATTWQQRVRTLLEGLGFERRSV